MTKFVLPTLVAATLLLAGSGCATSTTTTPSIWPAASPYTWLYHAPQITSSPEDAIGTIKNLQQSFVEWDAGRHFSSLEVDPYGLRAKWEWTEVTQETTYVPNQGGFFVGWDYVPTYGGSYQTQSYSTQKNNMFIIPFNGIQGLRLYHMPTLPRNYKYGLAVGLEQEVVTLRVETEKQLRQLADAIATLAAAQEAELAPLLIGVKAAPLTPEQRDNLALVSDTGIVVSRVAQGSPADAAGIRFLDVLMEADGQSLTSLEGLVAMVKAAKTAEIRTLPIKLLRREKVTRPVVNPKTQKTTGQEEVEETVEKTVNLTLV